MKFKLITSLLIFASFSIQASEKTQLPSPLTLDYVLNLPASMSPSVLAKQAAFYKSEAQLKESQALDSFSLGLQARLGQREFNGERQNHHLAALHFGLPLYDFGKTQKLNQAWLLDSEARSLAVEAAENEFRLMLMQAYFNVLLADMNYRVENEAMAIAFVTLDKVREDHALGRVSDVMLYDYEKNYQQAFVQRQRAQTNLRRTRMLLANTMGRSDAVISRLEMPRFNQIPDELARVELFLEKALANNVEIRSYQQAELAAQKRVASVKASKMPSLRADAWVGQLSSYPDVREGHWHAEISMSMPLFDSGLNRARLDREASQVKLVEADRLAAEQKIREQVTDLFFQLALLNVEEQAVEASKTFAAFNMDYKRALYENEQQSDFGDALVKISQADYDALAFELKRVMLWAQMAFLTGSDASFLLPTQPSENN
ncbi:TolC family protein [Thiomicrospira microaerophila]|uniref:TolC family protein n=1 Tax=Thiomicrospira microaerophila TaxID=406020 RepID=UPI00200BB95C|nr:TolC family protein [Thiomicrospira microaerophila]UQB43023.1 TolC family protein [Thiomicrospira microaerophila]